MLQIGDRVFLRPFDELVEMPYYSKNSDCDDTVLGIYKSNYIKMQESGERIIKSWNFTTEDGEETYYLEPMFSDPMVYYFAESMFVLSDDVESEINPVDIEAFLSIIG